MAKQSAADVYLFVFRVPVGILELVYEVEFSLKIFFIILRTVVLFIGWTLLARPKYEKNVISPS